jgi:hypothetical protein
MKPEKTFTHAPWPEEQEGENDGEFVDGGDGNKLGRYQIFFKFSSIQGGMRRRDSAVGIATGCGLEDQEVRVPVPV